MEAAFAPWHSVDDDGGGFAANLAWRVFRFHAGNIRHQIRDGKARLRPV